MSASNNNLKAAFAGESQANRRYLAFAKKAEDEGLPQIAVLFRAAAEAETVHAMNHLRIAGEIGMTISNLDEAISGETFEFTKMYPEFLEVSKQERNKQAEWSFNVANQVEEIHAELFQKALNALKANEEVPKTDYYVCKVCGNTVENSAPDRCSICGAPHAQFLKVT
ncbi:MAG: rubrerythrin family protein [Candidatus Bathyarchaeota archaeon]|nr:rubrerythrin family protein [Candidatus Bathyarchaeota archaeon]